jgi:hypothetical protein
MTLGIPLAFGVLTALALSGCSKPATCRYEIPNCGESEACAFVGPGESRCITYADVSLELQAPFKPGDSFWCAQRGRSQAGRSHSFQGDLFALDLASASPSSGVTIISPVDGIAYVYDGCEERDSGADAHNDSRCGLGYGNHVKVWDGTNIYLFGHLAWVHVKPGPIRRDEVLGEMGCSGAAGGRHVHLTVTRPRPGDDVERILATPGWKGQTPVRYRLVAHDAVTTAPVVAPPDMLSCAEKRAQAELLVR